MKQAKFIGLIILCAHILPLSSSDEENPYILRLNYGIVATKLDKLCLVEGAVYHYFHIRLPTEEAADSSVTSRPMNTTDEECSSTCERMTALHQAMINVVNAMKTAVRNLIAKINSVVIDLEAETTSVYTRKRIVKKGIVDGFGTLLKWFGGTATQGDL
jgi:hypothetical protein